MAIDTEAKRRSAGTHIVATTYPVPDTTIDSSDRGHAAWIYSGIAFRSGLADTIARRFQREPTLLISMEVPGDIMGTHTFFFSPKLGRPLSMQLSMDIRPYLLTFRGRPTIVRPDRAVTERGSVTLTIADDPNAPPFPSAQFSVTTGGSFWRRLLVTQPDIRGSRIEVKRGFIFAGMILADFELIFRGKLKDFDFQTDGSISLIAKDDLALSTRPVPSEISDDNLLDGAITASAVSITVDKGSEITAPSNLDSKDLFPITIRMQPESIAISADTAVDWTAATKRLTKAATGVFADYVFAVGDQIFLSHASITDGLFEITSKVNNDTIELVDSIFGSDLTGVVIDAREDIILKSIATNVLTVQENFLDKSEDFSDATWTKTGATITADKGVGPLGGDARADLIVVASTGDEIEQDSGETAAGEDWIFSVWLRNGPDSATDPGSAFVELVAGAQTFTAGVVLNKDAWQRVSVTGNLTTGSIKVRIGRAVGDTATEILSYGAQLEKSASTRGFYAATDGNAGADAGRGAFGSTAVAHLDNTPFSEVIVYRLHLNPESGVHPVVIVRDFVNRGEISSADVDQSTFDREFDFIQSTQAKRAGDNAVIEPRRLTEHLKQVRQQFLLDLWVSSDGKIKTRLSFRQNLPGTTVPTFTDEDNIVQNSLSIRGNEESRVTRAFVYFNRLAGADGDKPEDFQNVQVVVDLAVEVNPGPKSKSIFSRYIFRSADAIAVAGRLVSRFKRAARIASLSLDLKDEPDFFVGDVVALDSVDILKKSGSQAVRGTTQFQIIQKQHDRQQGRVKSQALEFSGLRYCIIAPTNGLEDPGNPFPDFPNASERERQTCFIGDADNLVNNGTELGYHIL